jgi:hypothetical protein
MSRLDIAHNVLRICAVRMNEITNRLKRIAHIRC